MMRTRLQVVKLQSTSGEATSFALQILKIC
nr:MAG TPA: hypothetical protein [Bacteriophage sp.]